MKLFVFCILIALSISTFSQGQEPHLTNIKQLTFGGDNIGAYFSADSKKISFQTNNSQWGLTCDQIYYLIIDEAEDNTTYQPIMVNNGEGRNTTSCYLPDGKKIAYASTVKSGKDCVAEPNKHGAQLWYVFPQYDLFISDEKGKTTKQLTSSPGYDAEVAVSPLGDKMVFTSTRNGDLDLYVMDMNGKNVKQLTFETGYESGAHFSPDGKQIVFAASRPQGKDTLQYKDLLSKGLVSPTNMELFIINIDGTGLKQLTHLAKSSWAPRFHPNGKQIIFSSDYRSANANEVQLHIVNTDGTGLEKITGANGFNAYGMFSPDGRKLVFSSTRNAGETVEKNLFIADWIEFEEVRISDW